MAKGDGLVMVNPTDGLVMPRITRAVDKRVISVDDLRKAQMVLEMRERLIFRLAVCEGMRPGEIMALRIGDIQDDGLHVRRRVYRGKIDIPKTTNSTRLVPLTSVSRALMVNYLDLISETRADAWLFASETGKTPLSYSNAYRRGIQPRLKAIGLGEVNFQVLRRTWVTEMSKAESDPKIRAQIAGHSVDVHENEYRQPDAVTLQRAMDKLDERLQ